MRRTLPPVPLERTMEEVVRSEMEVRGGREVLEEEERREERVKEHLNTDAIDRCVEWSRRAHE